MVNLYLAADISIQVASRIRQSVQLKLGAVWMNYSHVMGFQTALALTFLSLHQMRVIVPQVGCSM